MKRKFIVIIVIFICFCILALLYGVNIINYFREGESLSYNKEVSYIKIYSESSFFEEAQYSTIYNKEDIDALLNFINSLDLVEVKDSSNYGEIHDKGHFYIYMYGDGGILDAMIFSTKYVDLCHNGYDGDYTTYYIKDSKYNFISKTTKITKYIYDLINK